MLIEFDNKNKILVLLFAKNIEVTIFENKDN